MLIYGEKQDQHFKLLENITLNLILSHKKAMAHAAMKGINKLHSITIKEQSLCFGELLRNIFFFVQISKLF